MLEESGLDELVRALAAAIGGAVTVLSSRGDTIASQVFRRQLPEAALRQVRQEVRQRSVTLGAAGRAPGESGEFAPDHPEIAGRALVLPVSIRGGGAPAGVAGGIARRGRARGLRATDPPAGRDRGGARADAPARHARHGAAARRRRAGGGADRPARRSELRLRLRPFGVGADAAVLVFAGHGGTAAPDGGGAGPVPGGHRGRRARGRPRAAALRGGGRARGHGPGGARRAGAARRSPEHGVCGRRPRGRRRWARCGAASTRRAARSRPPRLANGHAPRVASYRDLGAFQLLLSLQDEDVLRLYCDSVLGPLEDATGEYGDELHPLAGGVHRAERAVGKAARELYCHRHTLR